MSYSKITTKFIKTIKILIRLEASTIFKYLINKKHKIISIKIRDLDIFIRKGTTDLRVAYTNIYDGEFNCLSYLLPKNFHGNIIDAGGYIGSSSLCLSRIFPNASIIAIEPSTKNIALLKMNTSAVRNISIIQGALVGSSKENIDLLDRRTGEWGFSTISNPLDISSPNYIEKVRAINIKSIINEYKNIGIFKIDIEGGEVDLFDCASNELSNIPVIFIEIHERIKPGSMETFINFSKNRHIVELGSNKFLSIKKDYSIGEK